MCKGEKSGSERQVVYKLGNKIVHNVRGVVT